MSADIHCDLSVESCILLDTSTLLTKNIRHFFPLKRDFLKLADANSLHFSGSLYKTNTLR